MKYVLLVLLFSGSGAYAQMYKCVDAKGATRYSDKPQPDCKGGEVGIKGQPPISGKLTERPGGVGDQERDFQRRQMQRGRDDDAEARRLAELKRRCAALHAQLDTLTRANIISKVNEKGERVYMDDATRDARIAQLKAEIARCPG